MEATSRAIEHAQTISEATIRATIQSWHDNERAYAHGLLCSYHEAQLDEEPELRGEAEVMRISKGIGFVLVCLIGFLLGLFI